MYDLLNRAAGWTECRVTGALPAAFLNRCAQGGIVLFSAVSEGDYALRVRLRSRDLPRARRLAQRAQCTLEVVTAGGAAATARRLRRRWPLAAALLLTVLLLAASKCYIWEIQVTGNQAVSTGRILDALRECGVDIGAFWPDFTSDNLRSELLTELPELSWATVNMYGSRAEVIVRERVKKPEILTPGEPMDLVSDRVGFVTRVRCLNGTPKVRPGSAVLPGETLISGLMQSPWGGDRLVRALGEVRAETYYELTAAAPLTETVKVPTGETRTRWAVTVGKKRWNFYGNSSISPGDCDTITSVWDLRRDGLFSLPLALLRETQREYEVETRPRDLTALRRSMEERLHARLLSELGPAGEIVSEHFTAAAAGDAFTVTLRARCSQEIGTARPHTIE